MSVLLKDQWLYVFGPFVLDPARRVLTRGDTPLSLPTKAFDLLQYLLENPDRVVSKDELFNAIWPGRVVEEGNLSQTVFTLRRTLGTGESSEGVIVTAPGHGYRIGLPVRAVTRVNSPVEPRVLPSLDLLHAANAPESALPTPRFTSRQIRISGAVLAILFLVAGGIFLVTSLQRKPPETETPTIVLADFNNTTGDAEFDGVLSRVAEIDLNQSPFLSILPSRKAQEILQQMGRNKDEKLIASVAQEVCERDQALAVVDGSIALIGDRYVVTLTATNCATGANIAAAKTEVAKKDDVVGSLDELTAKVRAGIGESHASIAQFDVPIAQATTPSFEALKAFSFGGQARAKGDNQRAIAFFKQAVDLDPSFAMAYVELGTINRSLHEQQVGNAYLKKAYELRDRVSEHEKMRLSALYQLSQDDSKGMIQSYKQWTQTYPHDWPPWANLSNLYTDSARYAEAIAAGQQALKLMPDHDGVYFVLARAYSRSNDFPNAKAICAQAVAKGLDGSDVHNLLYEIAYAENDTATMAVQVTKETSGPSEYLMLDSEGFAAVTSGRLRDGQNLFARAIDAVQKTSPDSAAQVASYLVNEMDSAINSGAVDEARRIAASAPNLEGNEFAPMVIAKIGDTARAAALADELIKRYPRESTVLEDDIPVTHAAIDLQNGKPLQAIAELEPALAYEWRNLELPSLLAQAYLDAHMPDRAADEYRKILAHRGVDGLSILYPLAHLGLARAEAQLNHTAESRASYDRFFSFWKEGDADLPVLQKARREYAQL